jgi:parvulin-like peptidyl-prolyl isomerase
VALIVLAAAVVLATAGYAAFRGLGDPSIPSDAIAVVDDAPNGTVTQDQYKAALFQAVPRLGLQSLPSTTSPQFAQVKDAAISDLLLQRWIEGEAADRGITASSSVIQDKLKSIVKTQFNGSQKQFDAFLKQSHFSQADALERVRLQVLSTRVQNAVLPKQPPKVSQEAIDNFYNANLTQFQQPETRDVRLILNKDKAQVDKAKAALSSDDSSASWAKVAKQYSTDPTTKASGGLRQAVAKGQSEPALDKALFSASAHTIVGPIKGQSGYYVIEVEAIHAATTTPLKTVQAQIQQQLAASLQQQIATNFQTDFVDKWTSRTFCASGYVISRCSNYTPPASCTAAIAQKTGCPAIVPATKPVEPGHAAVFFTIPPQLPQGPIQPAPAGGATLPGGTPIPLGPGGAPAPGSVPPGSVPPGSVPPAGATPSG